MMGGSGVAMTLLQPGYLKLELRGGIGETIHFEDVRKPLVANRNAVSLMVVIDSYGGLVSESDKIYEVIRSHPAGHKVAIIENAASAAVKLALACPKRWARHDTTLMIHQIQIAPPKRWTADRHQETAARLKSSDAKLAAFYAQRTGKMTPDWFRKQMQDDSPMPLPVAMTCGLIHRVLPAPARSVPMMPVAAPRPQAASTVPYLTRDMRAPGARAGS